MAKGPLRMAIEDFAQTSFSPSGGPGWWDRVKARWAEYNSVFQTYVQNHIKEITLPQILLMHAMGIMYAITGSQNTIDALRGKAPKQPITDVSELIAGALNSAFSQPAVKEIAESLGAVVTEPVLALFEQYAGKDDVNPKEFARAFHGLMVGLNIGGGIADTFLETITAGQVEGAGRLLQSVYWSLGLGFLGWQTLAPLLGSGLQPGLERYYKRLYRPLRFGAGDLRDLYALGEISPERMKEEARTLGWRDGDIDQWLKLAFRTLPQGDIFDAFHKGLISEDATVKRLRALGYDPNDIPLLFKLNPKEETTEARAFSVSNARNAFSEGLISEAELRKILASLKYSTQEIDIIVALEKLSKETKNRLLAAGDIKAAWTENVLTDDEARHWLTVAGFAGEQLDVLIETWKAEIIPDYRKLNAGTIEGAYVEGILTKGAARDKLVSVGFSPQDADLELSLVEKRNPEAFGQPVPKIPKSLAPGTLSELVVVGLITPAQMKDRLVVLGYTESDAGLLSEAARIRATPSTKLLPQRSIEDAFFAGVLTRIDALARLKALGFDDRTAGIVLDTIQAQLDQITTDKEEAQRKRLSPGTLEDLVIAGLITPEEMNKRLVENGYPQIDADLLTQRANQLAETPTRILSQSTIERAYLVGVLTREAAAQKLVGLDFTPQEADQILLTVEKENPQVFNPDLIQSTRQPSIGALVTALQMGILTQDEYLGRTVEIGYTPEDAILYTQIATKAERKSTKSLTVSQLTNAYGAGFLAFGIALQRITQQGYNDADATLILRMEKDLIQNTDVWNNLLAGTLDPFDAIAQLVNASYADKDILDAFAGLGPTVLGEMGIDIAQLAEALKVTPGGQ